MLLGCPSKFLGPPANDNTRYVQGCWIVFLEESRGAYYRANQNFMIKNSSLNFNVETCIGILLCPKMNSFQTTCKQAF